MIKSNIENLTITTNCPEEKVLRRFIYCGEKINNVEVHKFRCVGNEKERGCGREYSISTLVEYNAKDYKYKLERERVTELKRGCRR